MQAHHEFVSHPDMFNTLRFPLVLLHLSRLRSGVRRYRVHSDGLSARRAVLTPALAGPDRWAPSQAGHGIATQWRTARIVPPQS